MNIKKYILEFKNICFLMIYPIVSIFTVFLCVMFIKRLFVDWRDIIDSISKFGNLFLGIAAFYGVNVFASERKKKCSDAAALILAKIHKAKLKIVDAADRRALYQYTCFPGKLISDGTPDEKTGYPERPARMIEEIAWQLKIDVCDYSSYLPFEIIEGVNDIINEIQKESRVLANAVYEQLKYPKESCKDDSINSILMNYNDRFIALEERAKSLLASIIERGE